MNLTKTKRWLQPNIVALIGLLFITGSVVASQNENSYISNNNIEELKKQDLDQVNSTSITEKTESSNAAINPRINEGSNIVSKNDSVEIKGDEEKSKTYIKIDTSTNTRTGDVIDSTAPTLQINGKSQQLPQSGRFSQDTRSGDGRTRVSGRINSNNTSIDISTNDIRNTEIK